MALVACGGGNGVNNTAQEPKILIPKESNKKLQVF